MLEQSLVEPEELDESNFQEFLEDETFVDYFNTFLALPCFAERLFYNRECAQFEEFVEKLADDVGKGDAVSAYQLRKLTHFKGTIYNVTNNQSRIGYYVMVLDKIEAVDFVKSFRLPIFMRSELYAEYKLTMILSTIQSSLLGSFVEYEDTISLSDSRRRSIVSFNVDSSYDRDEDGTDIFGERSTADSPHVRTIDDTFAAWQDSFKRADSRQSFFSYAGGGNLKTPETTLDSDSDTSSTFGEKSQIIRPASAFGWTGQRRRSLPKVTWDRGVYCEGDGEMKASQSDSNLLSHGSKVVDNEQNITENKEMVATNDDDNDEGRMKTSQSDSNLLSHGGSKGVDMKQHITESREMEEATNDGNDEEGRMKNSQTDSNSLFHESTENDNENQITDNEGLKIIKDLKIDDKTNCSLELVDQQTEKQQVHSSVSLPSSSSESSPSINGNDDSKMAQILQPEKIVKDDEREDNVETQHSIVVSSNMSHIEDTSISDMENDTEKTTVVHEKLADINSRSNPSVTSVSELSIPIIVSDESSEWISGGISINNDMQSIDNGDGKEYEKRLEKSEDLEIKNEEIDNEVFGYKSDTKMQNEATNNIQEVSVTDVENGKLVERDENEMEQVATLVDENVDDLNYDLETNSEYTLKGIRGILRRRASVAATSVGFDFESDISEDDDFVEEDEKPFDLSTKEGLDVFKEFLLGTVAEKYLKFWMDIECLRHDENKNAMIQPVLQKYFKKGSLYELTPENIKRFGLQDLSNVTYDELQQKCCHLLEPVMNYWCARFTMHQHNKGSPPSLDYSRIVKDASKSAVTRENVSTSVTQEPDTCGMSQMTYTKQLIRPQSSRTHAQRDGEGSRPLTAKHRVRAKSAHPRLIPATTPVNTNASTSQLQNITSPVRGSYGFKPKKAQMFTNEVEPDYLSSVRLYINPIPTPDGKLTRMLGRFHSTAVSPIQNTKKVPKIENPTDALIDSLIEGLILEKQTGGYFENYLQRVGNKQWLDCLSFWKDLQDYNALFFAESLNPSTLSRKAMLMYARYVVGSGVQAIGVSSDIERQVFKQVDPPYEELFDAVEDFALRCLIDPWKRLQEKEKNSYSMVRTEQKLRHIEIQVMAKRRQSVIQTREHDGSESDLEKEKISIDEANRPMPIPKDGFSFESLIRNRREVEYFREFLSKKHTKGIKDLMAWTDMETFRRLPRFMEEKRDQKAKDVRSSWLTKKYFFGPDSPAAREGQDLIMNLNGGRTIKERPSTPVITESQKFVRARIERRWLMLFKQTAEFLDRQKPRVTAPEIVEDVMLKRRLQRSEAAWKILNSRWVSSSRDVVALRTCLLNPTACAEFKTFVALKGETFENDVDFWLEVQKFKDLCHAHSQESFIRRKVQAITDCFLNSAIAPELQIDIPIEMAEKLLERLAGRIIVHPYIFREAQMTVFRMLFNHWKEFIAYRSKVPAGETLQEHLNEKLKTMRAEAKAKREASERRRLARLSAERKKKEKEERERKRMEDLTSLFSIDTASVFYSEAPDDELNQWVYSKHVVEQERQEHIKRLKEQGLEIPPELLVEDKDDIKSRRSRLSASKLNAFDNKSVRSKRKSISVVDTSDRDWSDKDAAKSPQASKKGIQKPPISNRRGSLSPSVSLSIARRGSIMSRKSDKQSLKDEKAILENDNKSSPLNEEIKKVEEIKVPQIQVYKVIPNEIQVIPDKEDDEKQQEKLLNARPQKAKRLFHRPLKSKRKEVPLDAISCISDYSMFSNIDFKQKKRPTSSKKKVGDATPLTFKSLKDFTNSPEGAPLAIPLPLVRITSASNKDAMSDEDGSQGNAPTKSRNVFASPQPRINSAKRRNLTRKQECVIPDVIVN